MTMKFLVLCAFLLVSQPCTSRSVNDEESVVSVYTTLPSTGGHSGSLDVYQQIASNIAEKITSPIYRFFGFNTTEEKTTKRPFERVELPTNKPKTNKTIKDVPQRDVEELSEDFKKSNEKPEKFTLFSSYLPFSQNYEKNDSLELDDVFKFDNENDSSDNRVDSNKVDINNKVDSGDIDDSFVEVGDASTPRGPFVYLLELFGSIIQLLYGGFLSLFRPSNSDSSE